MIAYEVVGNTNTTSSLIFIGQIFSIATRSIPYVRHLPALTCSGGSLIPHEWAALRRMGKDEKEKKLKLKKKIKHLQHLWDYKKQRFEINDNQLIL